MIRVSENVEKVKYQGRTICVGDIYYIVTFKLAVVTCIVKGFFVLKDGTIKVRVQTLDSEVIISHPVDINTLFDSESALLFVADKVRELDLIKSQDVEDNKKIKEKKVATNTEIKTM